jgi:hypothetical protein
MPMHARFTLLPALALLLPLPAFARSPTASPAEASVAVFKKFLLVVIIFIFSANIHKIIMNYEL